MIANKKARVDEHVFGLKAGIDSKSRKMFPDPHLPTAESVGPTELRSEFGEGLGLMDSSFSYTDWLNMSEQAGRSTTSLPIIIEGSALQDDFWSDLMPSTPIVSRLKMDYPPCKDRFFDGALTDQASFSTNIDMIALGVVQQGAGIRMREDDTACSQKFGIRSTQLFSGELNPSGSMPGGIPRSFHQFEDTMDLLNAEDIGLDFSRDVLRDAEKTDIKSRASSKSTSPIFRPSANETHINFAAKHEKEDCSKSSGKGSNPESTLETRVVQEHSTQIDSQILPPLLPNKGSKVSQSTAGPQPPAKESRWAEQLLSSCASAIASRNIVRTQHLMWVLNDLASLAGDANQRLAAYGLKALFSRITGSASAYHQRNPPSSLGPRAVNRALLKFHDVNPWHQLVYTVTNGVLLESFEGRNHIHVVDIGISQGTQWPTFIEALATRASGAPELLRLTMVDDPVGTPFKSTPQSGTDPSIEFKTRLDRFAKVVGLNMELRILTIPLEDVTRETLALKSDEALGLCAQFRLHRLNENTADFGNEDGSCASAKSFSLRDKFLKFLRDLQPHVMILNENDVDHLATDFLARFQKVTDYHWKFLDSMSTSFKGRDCEERQIIEYELAMSMLNNIACEGSLRIERNDTHTGWTVRMQKAGFSSDLPTDNIMENVRVLLRKYDSNWDFVIDENCVVLLWKQQPVSFCSVWR
ncbi:hypothetical protein O6H91_17G066300 [Diphasiastrum complanatum]|uniref:Uncharacterized protein n=1 Tax=Diphasiastrum complanatum TaxID=34168 RepID=A0ACC2B8M7_DIPCM|nr:hypothetical protein O6H91_17G066300 [Diphasiastrum complanatum]